MRIINQDKQPLNTKPSFQLEQKSPAEDNKRISGLVISIVDGNTFVMSVQDDSSSLNADKYHQRVKIHGMNKPSSSTLSGILAKLELEKRIVGRRVECEILERDENGLIVAILPKEYLMPTYPFNPHI